MSPNRKPGRTDHNFSRIVRSDWSVGPRTAAWDRLWRTILSDLGAVPTTDARDSVESEVGDA
jgi:hypothetical protein